MTKQPLQTITIYKDVTEHFDPIKDESLQNGFTLANLKEITDYLITLYGPDADISAEIDGDEYYTEWTWHITMTRTETPDEQKVRLKQEADKIKEQQKYEKQKEQEEKKLYLKLKKKYEGK